MKLLRSLLLFLLLPSVAFATNATLTGTVLTVDGNPCDECKVNVTSPTTQSVDGVTITKGLEFSFKTTAAGLVPAGITLIQNAVIQLEVEGDLKAQVKVPAQATVDMSELITNVYSQSGLSLVDCEGTGKCLQFDILSGSFLCMDSCGGGGGGTGDITDVFSCSTGDCNLVHVQNGELLDTSGTGVIDATTAKALFADPAACAAGNFVTDMAANGTLTCAVPAVGGSGDITDVFSCTTGACTNVMVGAGQILDHTGGGQILASEAERISTTPSGCGPNQYAIDIDDAANLSCASVAFNQLTGTATAAQIPAAPLDCGAGQFAKGIDASLVLDCATPAAGGGGAPTTSTYITQTPDAGLSAEQAMSALGTGLTINTTATGVQSIYAGASCTNQFPRVQSASGAWTCQTVTSAYVDSSVCTSGGTGCPAIPPVGAKYVTQTADATLTNEQSLGLLTTGLTLNTVSAGTGVLSTKAANTCTNQFPRSDNASGVWTCASVADADLANNYSGIGACGANQWASTLNDNAAPTCTQPSFSNISGTATAGQIPAAPLDCSAGQFAKGIDASLVLDCATPATGAPTNATYITQVPDATLSAEQAMSALGTGLTINTTTTGVQSIYTGSSCTNQFPRSTNASGAWTCASVADADLANAYSGVGACAASKWVSTLNRNAAGTCTQPAFTDISGTLAHSSLSGLTTGDPHTQYALLAGRAGTANWLTLSTDVSGTIYGSAATGNSLLLRSNSADFTTGFVSLVAPLLYSNGNMIFDDDSTASQNFISFTDGTETVSSIITGLQFPNGTYTLDTNLSGIIGFNQSASMIVNYTATSNPVFSSIASTFNDSKEIRPTGGAAVAGTWAQPYKASITFNPTGAGTVMNVLAPGADYTSTPTYSVTSGGTFNAGSDRYGFYHKPTVNTGATILADRGVYIANKTGAGTLTFQMGVEIENLSGAVNQVGIRNYSTTTYAPCGAADPGATFTLAPTCTTWAAVPVGGARVSSATTAISDGTVDGQLIYVTNTGSANTLTIKAGANTDMAADCVLNRGGVAQYLWSAGESNWLQVSCSAN